MKKVVAELTTLPQLEQFFYALENRSSSNLIYGADGSSRTMLMAAIRLKTGRPLLVIAPDQLRAEKVFEDMVSVFGDEEVCLFPGRNLLYHFNLLSESNDISEQRITVLHRLMEGKNTVIVTTASAIMGKMIPPRRFAEFCFDIKKGQVFEVNDLLALLLEAGYERIEMVEQPGQISLRGGIMDIFPAGQALPCRIEFFGDTVESVRQFDLETQRSLNMMECLTVPAAREMVIGTVEKEAAIGCLKKELERTFTYNVRGNTTIVERMREKIGEHLEKLCSELYFPGIEQYLQYFYPEPSSLLDYLSTDTLLFIDDPPRCQQVAEQLSAELRETQNTLIAQGELLSRQAEFSFELIELLASCSQQVVSFSLFTHNAPYRPYRRSFSISSKPVPYFHGQWEMFCEELLHWRNQDYRIVILTSARQRSTGIGDILAEHDIPAYYTLSEPDLSSRTVVLLHGTLESGFILPEIKLALLNEQDILPQQKKRRRIKSKDGIRIGDYHDLQVNDHVVHEQHGIGRYLGVRTLDVGGTHRDYLYIQYAGNDKLFIPVEQVDLVRKYIGSEGKRPKLYALGGGEWSRVKAKVQASVQELAKELLALYAARETVSGFAFPSDHPWQNDFEASFPYEETPDQLQAISEVKGDMERIRPMDRLLCGDVGYGKTEVALRAAFKSVMSGKQVAFLVPTTVLAQQHYRNFLERLGNFPVTVAVLSRFQSKAEQKETLHGLKNGQIDVVIGTHRLLSKDLSFNELGLLIIDEEQRFGVKHKERIKMFKQNVDVMTMTATPIPRTLHMAMVGVRDMSVIETPPENRYPIQTYVLEYSETLIREAIIREVHRGGQVYFVYNRVQTIDSFAAKLKKLLPEIKIGVAHGQMAGDRLEQGMVEFLQGEYEVLLSTAIVEAGLDIPNVNTIIIYDADRFGLSQLYQLRGRVGRSNRIAYCYMTYQKNKVLTEMAEKRLQAIKEFTELGSGFKIALRDLEIRGAGNILGPEQHGFMMSVGFDLYVKLLEEAMQTYKGEGKEQKPLPRVELNVDAYLPSTYISDARQKIVFYQKFASLQSIEDVAEVREELGDRYGMLPNAVENLLKVADLKLLASNLSITSISEEKNNLVICFANCDKIVCDKLLALSRKYKGKLTAGKQFVLILDPGTKDPNERINFLHRVFHKLINSED